MAVRKREVSVNLVRDADSETYQIVSDYDLTVMRGRHTLLPEKGRVDEKRNMYGHFYIKMPKK